MLEGGSGGIVFKWINKQEVMNKHTGQAKTQSLQTYINKLHVDYIATRPGTVFNENVNHGLFGMIYNEDYPESLDELELSDIENRIKEVSKKNIDIFKTVFSMKEEDVLRYGIDQNEWKNILNKRISDIAKASNIPPESIEWTASFHNKKGNPHCHLVFWNKDQNLNLNKKPFINFKEIRKAISKEVYKGEIERLYDTKNVSKKEIKNMTKLELENYREKLKEELNNPDLNLREVDTDKEEKLLKKITESLKPGDKVFLYNKDNPEQFTEIKKETKTEFRRIYGNEIKKEIEVLKFRNNAKNSFLYKNDDFTDSACFLADFEDIEVVNSKEELENIIKEKNEKDLKIDNELREIIPDIVPNNILSHEFREKSFEEIVKRIASLKTLIQEENMKALNKDKITFRYDLQQPKVKKEIDRITVLILNTSKDCKLQFNNYISSSLDIARLLSDIENKTDYERVKQVAKDEAYNKIGNQILSFLKESMNEDYKEKYEFRKLEYESKKLEYSLKQEEFERQMKENEARKLINGIFNMLDTNNISQNARHQRIKHNLDNMTKEQLRAYMKIKENSAGFEWFE